jgi:hypothetical protein
MAATSPVTALSGFDRALAHEKFRIGLPMPKRGMTRVLTSVVTSKPANRDGPEQAVFIVYWPVQASLIC